MELLQTDVAAVENHRYRALQISTYDVWLPRPAGRRASSSDSAAATLPRDLIPPGHDQDREAIEQTPCELPLFAFKTGEDFSESDNGDCKLSLHSQQILGCCRYSIEMVDHDDGINQDRRIYFYHSFRNRR
jgi:hypothetical protein